VKNSPSIRARSGAASVDRLLAGNVDLRDLHRAADPFGDRISGRWSDADTPAALNRTPTRAGCSDNPVPDELPPPIPQEVGGEFLQ